MSGGADFVSAFYFRGYEQADHGPILQPYLNLWVVREVEDVVFKPYVSFFHSANWGAGNQMADMTDVMVGTTADWGGLSVDARWAWYNMNPLMRSPVNEVGAKVGYDVLSRWADRPDAARPFRLKPFVGVFGQFDGINGEDNLFVNLGVEPSWRFHVRGHAVGMSLPVDWGLGANGYYFNADGSNASLGYFSTALVTSVALPLPRKCGQWFLNTTVQYLHLAADSTQQTAGRDDACVGKIGLSFVY
jgi:hypothetical protein